MSNLWGSLQLVAWTVRRSSILEVPDDSQILEMPDEELSKVLYTLWGSKLGNPDSREARSAQWIIAALSDFNGQIQARDIVRFLLYSAEESRNDAFWNDRILVPTAIRSAVNKCSNEKITEIKEENPALGEVFNRLMELEDEYRVIPFTRDRVNLSSDEINLLETNGVILRAGQEYYLPEIFRDGLGFKLVKGARPRVLALLRRARNRAVIR